MRRGFLAGVLAVVLLCGCSAEQPGQVEALAEKYAALSGYVAEVKIDVPRADETLHYTLSVCGEGEETRVCVLAPEELAGVTATLQGEDLTLSYDDLVLDAGSLSPHVSALNGVPLVLRAAAEGYACAENTEQWGEQEALRVCYETEWEGETLYCTVFFAADDAPLYAEIAQEEKNILFLEFTNFTFGDIIN